MDTVDRLRLWTALVCSGLGLGLVATPVMAAPAIAASAAAVTDCEMVAPDGDPSQDQFRLEGDRSLAPILRRDHARYLADRIDQTYHQMLTALEADQVILLGRCGEIYQRFAALQPEVDSLVAEAEATLGLIDAALAAQGLKHNDGALSQPAPTAAVSTDHYEIAIAELHALEFPGLDFQAPEGQLDYHRPLTQAEYMGYVDAFFAGALALVTNYSDPLGEAAYAEEPVDDIAAGLIAAQATLDRLVEVATRQGLLQPTPVKAGPGLLAAGGIGMIQKELSNIGSMEQIQDIDAADPDYAPLQTLLEVYGLDLTHGTGQMNPNQPLTVGQLAVDLWNTVNMLAVLLLVDGGGGAAPVAQVSLGQSSFQRYTKSRAPSSAIQLSRAWYHPCIRDRERNWWHITSNIYATRQQLYAITDTLNATLAELGE